MKIEAPGFAYGKYTKADDGIDAVRNEPNANLTVEKVTAPAVMSLLASLLLPLSQIVLANPTAEPLPTLTARELVRTAIEEHPDLATFQARLDAAGAQARGSSSERLPRLAVEAGTQHFNTPSASDRRAQTISKPNFPATSGMSISSCAGLPTPAVGSAQQRKQPVYWKKPREPICVSFKSA